MIPFLLHWVAPIVALVYVLGYSLLFEPVRKWERLPGFIRLLLDCPMCLGFWVGAAVGLANAIPVAWPPWIQFPVLGALLAVALEYCIEVWGRNGGEG